MRNSKLFYCLILSGLLTSPSILFSQVITPSAPVTGTPADSLVNVDILAARHLTILKLNDSTTLQILAGGVKMKQGTSLFTCDSCVMNSNNKTFEAWGNVHINDADTANIYSSHLRYLYDKRLAYLDGNVRLTDGKGTLTTPDLEYDMNTDIGIYKHGGKVVNKKTVLTSKEGYYYAGLRDVYFKNSVLLKDPAYTIKTDSLLYNLNTQTTRFIAETFIKDSSGRTIETKEGYYNVATGKAEFGRRPKIRDGKIFITGDNIAIDDSTGISQAKGNVIIIDSAQGTTILAGEVFRDNKNDRILATRKPLMIVKQDADSIYITADTLFSARLSDLYIQKDTVTKDSVKGINMVRIKKDSLTKDKNNGIDLAKKNRDSLSQDTIQGMNLGRMKKDSVTQDTINGINLANNRDTIKGIDLAKNKKDSIIKDTIKGTKVVKLNNNDSTNRYFEAYRNVRIFADSMQAVCDSLFYSFQDSTFRLFQNPILWAKESQITGDTVFVFTKNKKADRAKVFENSFLVNQIEPGIYNQVSSSRMDGFFKEGTIDSVRAAGFAECIYYIQDEDSAYTGINESKCDIMDIYFGNQALKKVVFRSDVTGTIWPMKQKTPEEMRLPRFTWMDDRRPKTKFELF